LDLDYTGNGMEHLRAQLNQLRRGHLTALHTLEEEETQQEADITEELDIEEDVRYFLMITSIIDDFITIY